MGALAAFVEASHVAGLRAAAGMRPHLAALCEEELVFAILVAIALLSDLVAGRIRNAARHTGPGTARRVVVVGLPPRRRGVVRRAPEPRLAARRAARPVPAP